MRLFCLLNFHNFGQPFNAMKELLYILFLTKPYHLSAQEFKPGLLKKKIWGRSIILNPNNLQ